MFFMLDKNNKVVTAKEDFLHGKITCLHITQFILEKNRGFARKNDMKSCTHDSEQEKRGLKY